MAFPIESELEQALLRRKEEHLYRRRRICETPQGVEMQCDGQQLLTFCSNDYLGLATHPEIAAAMSKGVDQWGVGSGAAHLVNGHSSAHHALEKELAEWLGRERAQLFSTGYMANIGVINALMGRSDHIFEDRLNHASLIDGGLSSGARLHRYHHGDMAMLNEQMAAVSTGRKLVATDGVFSMDGDCAPLEQLATICQRHEAMLMVDDAHGIGVLGSEGRGSVDHYGLDQQQAPILMGTLGKAFGVAGAFVAGSDILIETLIQEARTAIFTTATPSALAEAVRASLKIVRREEWRREHLQTLVARFRNGATQIGLPLMQSETPIQPLMLGDAEEALRWSRLLEESGILVTAIRPPTVPKGESRLRITLSANHREEHVDRLLDALEKISRKLSL